MVVVRLRAVRRLLVALILLVTCACAADQEPTGYCGRALPTPSHGSTQVSKVQVKAGDVISGFPEGVQDFYGMPLRTPKPLVNGATRIDPHLPGLPDGEYVATFVTFPVPGIRHHGVRMTVEGRSFVLDGPKFCS